MTCYSLDIALKAPTEAPLVAALAALPIITAGGILPSLYEVGVVGPVGTMESGFRGSAMVRFVDTVTRTAALDAVSVVSGVLSGFDVGSSISLHTCHHDETPPLPCEAEVVYEVTP
jgi:hypothetical protein